MDRNDNGAARRFAAHAVKPAPNGPVTLAAAAKTPATEAAATEIAAAGGERGGPSGPEPTRFGDWERNGRCVDF